MVTQQDILDAINASIASTKSERKKRVGLPRLEREIRDIPANDIRAMIRLLLIACAEPAPHGRNPPNLAVRYWVNRHAWTLVSGLGKTSTRLRFEEIIAQYRSQIIASPLRVPVYLDATTVIDAAMVLRMRAASRLADREIVLFGHGETLPGTKFSIPRGTSITFYTPRFGFLMWIDVRAIAAPEVWGRYRQPKGFTVISGTSVDDHMIGQYEDSGTPPNQLGGTWCRDRQPRALSGILRPDMGNVHFVACRCLPESDPTSNEKGSALAAAFLEGQGRLVPGPEPFPLSDAQTEELAKRGGFPRTNSDAEYAAIRIAAESGNDS